MSGVWVFRNGVVRLVENPAAAAASDTAQGKKKALVHTPSGEVITSHAALERKLAALGWERYHGGGDDSALMQFHKRGSVGLISLPKDFSRFASIHMYDIVVKNRDAFRVVDA
ncbi:hypothetical protein ACP70R_048758 [Stipagrostis hirtigluma subsp. patula]